MVNLDVPGLREAQDFLDEVEGLLGGIPEAVKGEVLGKADNLLDTLEAIGNRVVGAAAAQAANVTAAVSRIADGIKALVKETAGSVLQRVNDAVTVIVDDVKKAREFIVGKVEEAISAVGSTIRAGLEALGSQLRDVGNLIVNAVHGAARQVTGAVTSVGTLLQTVIAEGFQSTIQTLGRISQGLLQGLGALGTTIGDVVGTAASGIVRAVSAGVERVRTLLAPVLDVVANIIPPLLKAIGEDVSGLAGALAGLPIEIAETIGTAVLGAFGAAADGVDALIEALPDPEFERLI